jgi:glucose/arabinose dehydrogenase
MLKRGPGGAEAAASSLALALALALAFMLAPQTAGASPPGTPTITEPVVEGQLVHPGDVHMEASGFFDPDGHAHHCSDWEIRTAEETVWQAPCAGGLESAHIHLGDGSFVNSYAGRTELDADAQYVLRVRFHDTNGEVGAWAQRSFGTYPPSSPGGVVPWTPVQPGYVIETITDQLQLPVNVAFVPAPGGDPDDPLLYVTELYGKIKVIRRDGAVSDYAAGLLNFNPTGAFPGSGEQGLTGIVVDPATGDVFASRVYDGDGSAATSNDHYPEVVRFHSADGGLTAATETPVLRMPGETQGQSHQISNLSFGPDGKLYVHNGDGFSSGTALNLDSFRGKVLRMNLDGSPPADNPFYDAWDGVNARDYVFAYGFRNPFGGAWRAANGAHYEVENGPSIDRLVRVVAGEGYGWDGTNASMTTAALYNWDPAHAPVNIAFIQRQTFLGSGFPASQMDQAFVTESGPTYATGPQLRGKRIVQFVPGVGGELGDHPRTLVEYTGTGKATAVGLAAGPDGLYFTDLYRDLGASSPIDPGARLLRVRYVGTSPECRLEERTLSVEVAPDDQATIARLANGAIEVNGEECGATAINIDQIAVAGAGGDETVILDLAGGPLAPGILGEPDEAEIEVSLDLGAGQGDTLAIEGGAGADRLALLDDAVATNEDSDADVTTAGVERFNLVGLGGSDLLFGNSAPNLLDGGSGEDTISGAGGADVLVGGTGADRLVARDGVAEGVFCGGEDDFVQADEPGIDALFDCEAIEFPGSGATCAGIEATIAGTAAAETIAGTGAADVIAARGGNDTVKGLAGDDLLCGGAGSDRLIGGEGRDRLLGRAGGDRFTGGRGRDRCDNRRTEPTRSCA